MNNVCNLVIFKSCLSSTSFHFKGLRIRDVVAVLRRPRAADTVLLSSLGDENSSQRSSLRSARGRRVCVFTRFAGNEIKKKTINSFSERVCCALSLKLSFVCCSVAFVVPLAQPRHHPIHSSSKTQNPPKKSGMSQ